METLAPHRITIRRVQTSDLSEVLRAEYLFDDPPHADALAQLLSDPATYLIIGYADGEPAGFARAHELLQTKSPERQMFIYEIQTAPQYRRLGVARAIIGEIRNICASRGLRGPFVITHESNAGAMAFFKATGGARCASDDVVFVYGVASPY